MKQVYQQSMDNFGAFMLPQQLVSQPEHVTQSRQILAQNAIQRRKEHPHRQRFPGARRGMGQIEKQIAEIGNIGLVASLPIRRESEFFDQSAFHRMRRHPMIEHQRNDRGWFGLPCVNPRQIAQQLP